MSREIILNAAEAEGFSLLGISPAVAPAGYSSLLKWIEDGFAGEMDYFQKRREAYRHPNSVLEGVRSIVMLAYPYPATPALAEAPSSNQPHGSADSTAGRIARYASTGKDYHDEIHPKLKRLCKVIKTFAPDSANRGVVDTAPLLEREFAQLSGLGWIGKNTLLINKHQGSYFFLACILTSLELEVSAPHSTSHCGTCTACLDACPTDAFPEPGRLDSRKCISYLTIEHRGSIPYELRSKIGEWVFGCDVCQEVCPWNKKPTERWIEATEQNKKSDKPHYRHSTPPTDTSDHPQETARKTEPDAERTPQSWKQILDLTNLFLMDEDAFRKVFRKTPMWRPRRRGLLRNAAIVLGNQRDPKAIPALEQGLKEVDPIVRGACIWALGNLSHPLAKQLIKAHQIHEDDPDVLMEISTALQNQKSETNG